MSIIHKVQIPDDCIFVLNDPSPPFTGTSGPDGLVRGIIENRSGHTVEITITIVEKPSSKSTPTMKGNSIG